MESVRLFLTSKGQMELVQNVHRLNLKKRSVLLLLKNNQQTPLSFSEAIRKGVLPAAEIRPIVDELVREEFVRFEGNAGAMALQSQPVEVVAVPATWFDESINLSEARYLLNDFCLEIFKTQAARYAQPLAECKTVEALEAFVKDLRNKMETASPTSVERLDGVIQEIKDSAH